MIVARPLPVMLEITDETWEVLELHNLTRKEVQELKVEVYTFLLMLKSVSEEMPLGVETRPFRSLLRELRNSGDDFYEKLGEMRFML